MTIRGALHNDAFGDIPPSMEFGDLWVPGAKSVTCNRCEWTYYSLDEHLNARALATHHRAEHTYNPTGEEEQKLRRGGWLR